MTDVTANDAIQEDASDSQEVAEQSNDPRMDAIERIAVGRRAALAEEVDGEIGNTEPEPAPEPEETVDDQIAAQAVEPEPKEDQKVRVKVDGVEMELPLSEVVKSYQKDAAATKRLQAATELLRAAEERAAAAEQVKTQIQDEAPSDEESLGRIKEAFSKLYEGDEDGAAQAMLALLAKGAKQTVATQAPQVDTDAIAAAVKQQLEVDSAYEKVRSDYPELFAESERGIVLGRETYQRMTQKASAGISHAQALRESAEEVAALFGVQKAGRSDPPVSTARDEKLARKSKLDNPRAANVVAGGVQSPAEQNVSATIQEIARSRLGQTMNIGQARN